MYDPGFITEGQMFAEERMLDTVSVDRPTGRQVQNEITGLKEPVYTPLFTSKARVQDKGTSAGVAETSEGGRVVVELGLELHLPISTAAVRSNDRVTVASIGPGSDPQLLGSVFYVVSSVTKSRMTARRILIERR